MGADVDGDVAGAHALPGDLVRQTAPEPLRPARPGLASAASPNGSSSACWRVARMSARPMP